MASPKSKSGTAASSGSRRSARELAKAQAAATKRRSSITQIVVIAAVALVVIGIIGSAVLISVLTQNSRTPSADTKVQVGGKEIPFAVDGTAVRLGPADAKVTVDLYVDYACPHCKDYEEATAKTYEQLLTEGDVAVKYHLIAFQSVPYATTAGAASAAVAARQPQDWLAFHSALFVNQTQQTSTWQNADLRTFAEQNGITNPDALKEIGDGQYSSWITSNTGDAVKAGIEATPTLLTNGQKQELLTGQQLIDHVHQLAGR